MDVQLFIYILTTFNSHVNHIIAGFSSDIVTLGYLNLPLETQASADISFILIASVKFIR